MQKRLDFIWNNWSRLGGAAGLIFIVLFLIAVSIAGTPPDYTKPASEIQAWFTDNSTQFLVSGYIIGLAVLLFFLPFLAALRSYLGIAEDGRTGWSRFAFASGVIFLVYTGAASFFSNALAVGVARSGDAATVKALSTLDFYAFGSAPLVAAPFFFASAMVILRTGVTWRVLAWFGLALSVLGIIGGSAPINGDPTGVLSRLGFGTQIGLLVWVALLSISMIVRKTGAETTA